MIPIVCCTLQKSGGYYPPKRVENVCPKEHTYFGGNQTPQWFSPPTRMGLDRLIMGDYCTIHGDIHQIT